MTVLSKHYWEELKITWTQLQTYADIPGIRALDNPLATIPESIVVTTACPDVVIIEQKDVTLSELTIPQNSSESMSGLWKRKAHISKC